jgi:hypothetical protein
MKKIIIGLICLLSVFSGCAINRATGIQVPGTDLSKVKNFYVVEELADKGSNDVYNVIAQNLIKRGYNVRTGVAADKAFNADVLVTYQDKWMWDITMYLLRLNITFRDPATNATMAQGSSYHTSLTRLSPEEMVEEVLTNIFNAKKGKISE